MESAFEAGANAQGEEVDNSYAKLAAALPASALACRGIGCNSWWRCYL